tara:strand:- start:123 stop:635 length:513 start_codon:yes stop_codon:yes gene_type:complete
MEYLYYQLKMTVTKSKKDYANKVLQMDPLSERLNAAGFTGGAGKYLKSLKTTAKPLIDKSLKKAPLETRNFKGAAGAPVSVKKQLLTVDKLQKVNQENLMFDRANPNLIRNTQKLLKKVEKDIRSDFRKTDQGKKNTEENRIFRKFLKEQKKRKDTFKDDGTPYGGRDFS